MFICFPTSQTNLEENRELIDGITGFEDSVRKCEYHVVSQYSGLHFSSFQEARTHVRMLTEKDEIRFSTSLIQNIILYLLSSSVICHVVGITYQTIGRRLLAEMLGDPLGKTNTAGALLNPHSNLCYYL